MRALRTSTGCCSPPSSSSALEDEPDLERTANLILLRLDLEPEDAELVRDVIRDRDLLWSAAHQPGALTEERVLELAAHLDTPERARTQYLLSALRNEGRERWEMQRLRALYELVQATLADDAPGRRRGPVLAERRQAEAADLSAGQPGALERLASAPRAYVLRTPIDSPGSPRRACSTPSRRRTPRVAATRARTTSAGGSTSPGTTTPAAWPPSPRCWPTTSLVVDDAVLATWPDGAVLDSFHVPLGARPDR